MVARRPLPLVPLIGAMVAGAAVAGAIGWRLNLQAMDERIKDKHSALKKLVLSGRIPPNEEVQAYLTSRQSAIERRYQHWLALVASPPIAEAAVADPQLYFQEQFHEVQRTLERLAAARSMAVPEQLGFPKELPPSDTVPRLLAQLSLIQEAATLIFEQGVIELSSLKVEDPQSVSGEETEAPFLVQLPVRVRLHATLPQLMKVLGAIQRASPLIDVQAVHVLPAAVSSSEVAGAGQPTPPLKDAAGGQAAPPAIALNDSLDVELTLARYLVSAQPEPLSEEAPGKTGQGTKVSGVKTTRDGQKKDRARPTAQPPADHDP